MSHRILPKCNTVIQGDCIEVLGKLDRHSVDLTVTDPPYLVRYRARDGRRVCNDDRHDWLAPSFREIYRVMKPDTLCVSFYGWNNADLFLTAWRAAGFRPVGHLVFRKRYASSSAFLSYRHEQAYLLAKGRPQLPDDPIADVIDWAYTGNHLHPTQKPLRVLSPLIEAFSKPGDVVLDPFCGSGSTLLAAKRLDRDFIGIELDPKHHETASRRILQ